ncbi:MAG: hypothetical protein U5M51_13665 [Emticicia sp.]|nr:hypothetical protein [Emticicia sp.]
MKPQDLYFKRIQNTEQKIYHYARLIRSVNPPVGEIINRLNTRPIIDMEEYHQKDFGNKVKYEAFFEVWERIEASEYQAEFDKVTAEEFDIYLDGIKQSKPNF